jgi:hypothetical protein
MGGSSQISGLEAAGVGFVVIQMDIGGEIRADPDLHPLKNHRALGEDPEPDGLLVLYTHPGSVRRGHVDMPLGGDDALGKADLPPFPL